MKWDSAADSVLRINGEREDASNGPYHDVPHRRNLGRPETQEKAKARNVQGAPDALICRFCKQLQSLLVRTCYDARHMPVERDGAVPNLKSRILCSKAWHESELSPRICSADPIQAAAVTPMSLKGLD